MQFQRETSTLQGTGIRFIHLSFGKKFDFDMYMF